MAKDLNWFKWKPAHWAFGNIQRRSKEAKVAFIDLLGKYWTRRGNMTIKDAELGFGKAEVAELLEYEIIKMDEDGIHLRISFLDEQLAEIEETSHQNSEAGKKSALLRKLKNGSSTPVQQPSNRTEQTETRQDQIKNSERIEALFKEFPNTSYFEQVMKALFPGKDPSAVMPMLMPALEGFRQGCDLEYKSMKDFAQHFKNWYPKKWLKNMQQEAPPLRTTVSFGKKNRQ